MPTNQYVAAVTFLVDSVETHVQAYYQAQDAKGNALEVDPGTSNFNVSLGILQTKNVLIDCTDLAGTCVTFQLGGTAAHAGRFTEQLKFSPQQQ